MQFFLQVMLLIKLMASEGLDLLSRLSGSTTEITKAIYAIIESLNELQLDMFNKETAMMHIRADLEDMRNAQTDRQVSALIADIEKVCNECPPEEGKILMDAITKGVRNADVELFNDFQKVANMIKETVNKIDLPDNTKKNILDSIDARIEKAKDDKMYNFEILSVNREKAPLIQKKLEEKGVYAPILGRDSEGDILLMAFGKNGQEKNYIKSIINLYGVTPPSFAYSRQQLADDLLVTSRTINNNEMVNPSITDIKGLSAMQANRLSAIMEKQNIICPIERDDSEQIELDKYRFDENGDIINNETAMEGLPVTGYTASFNADKRNVAELCVARAIMDTHGVSGKEFANLYTQQMRDNDEIGLFYEQNIEHQNISGYIASIYHPEQYIYVGKDEYRIYNGDDATPKTVPRDRFADPTTYDEMLMREIQLFKKGAVLIPENKLSPNGELQPNRAGNAVQQYVEAYKKQKYKTMFLSEEERAINAAEKTFCSWVITRIQNSNKGIQEIADMISRPTSTLLEEFKAYGNSKEDADVRESFLEKAEILEKQGDGFKTYLSSICNDLDNLQIEENQLEYQMIVDGVAYEKGPAEKRMVAALNALQTNVENIGQRIDEPNNQSKENNPLINNKAEVFDNINIQQNDNLFNKNYYTESAQNYRQQYINMAINNGKPVPKDVRLNINVSTMVALDNLWDIVDNKTDYHVKYFPTTFNKVLHKYVENHLLPMELQQQNINIMALDEVDKAMKVEEIFQNLSTDDIMNGLKGLSSNERTNLDKMVFHDITKEIQNDYLQKANERYVEDIQK